MKSTSIHPEINKVIDFKELKVTSSAFEEDMSIPSSYTCDGKDVNPPLAIDHIPENAKCLAIIVDDPDAPSGTWVHWVAWNIPVTHQLKENAIHCTEGLNDFKKRRYNGPCPPSGTHRYHYKVYALDSVLDLPDNTEKSDLERAMASHVLAFGELVGRYSRTKKE